MRVLNFQIHSSTIILSKENLITSARKVFGNMVQDVIRRKNDVANRATAEKIVTNKSKDCKVIEYPH